MSGGPPETFDPWMLARTQGRLRGSVAMAAMPRLASLLLDDGGAATFDLCGETDAEDRACLTGLASARIRLTCQRCLQPLELELEVNFDLVPVTCTDEAKTLPADCEPLMVSLQGRVKVSDIVEDELILGLPLVAHHQDGGCASQLAGRDDSDSRDTSRQRPFADLAEILARNNGKSKE